MAIQPEKKSVDQAKPEADKNAVSPAAEPTKAETNPFDLTKLRLDQSFTESGGTKKLLTTVPARKPNPQDFIRTHPSLDYRGTFAVIKLRDDRDAFYLVVPEIAKQLPGEFFMATIFTAINRQGIVFLWPVRLPTGDNRTQEWHRSEMEAAERTQTQWLRVKANMSLGAYEMFEPLGMIPEPDWSTLPTYQELLSIGFRGRLVDRLDHAVVQRLRG
jgi:hypothetical protein